MQLSLSLVLAFPLLFVSGYLAAVYRFPLLILHAAHQLGEHNIVVSSSDTRARANCIQSKLFGGILALSGVYAILIYVINRICLSEKVSGVRFVSSTVLNGSELPSTAL